MTSYDVPPIRPRDPFTKRPATACERASADVWSYLDRELAHTRELAIALHLEECTRCRGLFAFNRAFLRAIRSTLSAL